MTAITADRGDARPDAGQIGRLDLYIILMAIGLGIVVVTGVSSPRATFVSRDLYTALNGLVVGVAAMAALAQWNHYTEERSPAGFLLSAALTVLAIANGSRLVITVLGVEDRFGFSAADPGQAPVYAWFVTRLFAAGLFGLAGIALLRQATAVAPLARLIGLESHADLQSIGSRIESVAEQLHQPQIALNHRIVFVETRARSELRADEPEAHGITGAERFATAVDQRHDRGHPNDALRIAQRGEDGLSRLSCFGGQLLAEARDGRRPNRRMRGLCGGEKRRGGARVGVASQVAGRVRLHERTLTFVGSDGRQAIQRLGPVRAGGGERLGARDQFRYGLYCFAMFMGGLLVAGWVMWALRH